MNEDVPNWVDIVKNIDPVLEITGSKSLTSHISALAYLPAVLFGLEVRHAHRGRPLREAQEVAAGFEQARDLGAHLLELVRDRPDRAEQRVDAALVDHAVENAVTERLHLLHVHHLVLKVTLLPPTSEGLRIDALNTDEEIERRARSEYNLIRPDEEAYAVLPPPRSEYPVPGIWPFAD